VVDSGIGENRTSDGFWFVYMFTVLKPEYLR
jgi:hypothetical protein